MTAARWTAHAGALVSDVPALVARVSGGSARRHDILAFCAAHRRCGIAALLEDASPDRLRVHLYKSGRAFLHHLRSAAPDGPDRQVLSQSLPLFDAIAALDREGAAEIARLSRTSRQADLEYEEDYLYHRFLRARFFGVAPLRAEDEQNVFQRWEEVLEGSPDPRLDVCRALAALDGELFHAALDRYLEEKESRTWRLADRGALRPEELATEGHVSIEGLTLVLLAESLGLPTREDYLLIPSLAREGAAPGMDSDAWLNLDG